MIGSKELKDFEIEKVLLEEKTEIYKNSFGDSLINGMGDEMINYLNSPPKISVVKRFKIKFKIFLNKLIDVL